MKFKCPLSFQLKGKRWLIHFVKSNHAELTDEDGNEVYSGSTNIEKRIIYVDKELKKLKHAKEFERVVIHEVAHAALFEAHLNEASNLNEDTEEIICETVADLLIFTIKKYFYK